MVVILTLWEHERWASSGTDGGNPRQTLKNDKLYLQKNNGTMIVLCVI
jgi:hypothetical protein